MESVDIDADEKAGQAVEPARETHVSDMVVALEGSDESDERAAQDLAWPRPVLSPNGSSPEFCASRSSSFRCCSRSRSRSGDTVQRRYESPTTVRPVS